VLKGAMRALRHFAQQIVSERGVRHGQLVTVPVEFENQKLRHHQNQRIIDDNIPISPHEREASVQACVKSGSRWFQPRRPALARVAHPSIIL